MAAHRSEPVGVKRLPDDHHGLRPARAITAGPWGGGIDDRRPYVDGRITSAGEERANGPRR